MTFRNTHKELPDQEPENGADQAIVEADEGEAGKKASLLSRLAGLLPKRGAETGLDATSQDMSLDDLGVLALGSKKVAIGLTWATPEDDISIKEKIQEMNELNSDDPTQQTVDFKYYTDPRKTGFIGIGSADWGHKTGMKPLVTMMNAALTGPRWIGVFQISEAEDTWWVGSIRDGKVFEDQILRSRHQAEQVFLRNLEAPDWTSVFAPLDWGLPETREEKLYQLVDMHQGAPLKSITPIKDNLPRIILGIVILGLGSAGYVYFEHRKAQELERLMEMRRQAQQGVTYSPRDLPWYQSTRISDFIDSCMREIDKSIILVPGWEAQPISCTISKGQGQISTGWLRSGGRFTWLRASISPDEPVPVMALNGESASWSRSFTAPVDDEAEKAEPWAGNLIESRLRERFQIVDMDLAMRPNAKNQPVARTRPVFNSHDLRLTSEIGLSNFGDMLADVPALVPEAVVYNLETNKWDLAIKAYHPVLLPPQPK